MAERRGDKKVEKGIGNFGRKRRDKSKEAAETLKEQPIEIRVVWRGINYQKVKGTMVEDIKGRYEGKIKVKPERKMKEPAFQKGFSTQVRREIEDGKTQVMEGILVEENGEYFLNIENGPFTDHNRASARIEVLTSTYKIKELYDEKGTEIIDYDLENGIKISKSGEVYIEGIANINQDSYIPIFVEDITINGDGIGLIIPNQYKPSKMIENLTFDMPFPDTNNSSPVQGLQFEKFFTKEDEEGNLHINGPLYFESEAEKENFIQKIKTLERFMANNILNKNKY